MAKSSLKKLFDYILPKGKNRAGGVSYTDTYDPSNATKALDMPQYQQHLTDIAEREDFRKFSFVSLYAEKMIKGLGFEGYKMALEYLAKVAL